MNFAFTEEQEMLREAVRGFLEQYSPISAVRAQMETADGFDAALWERMTNELGLPALAIPEAYGGQGFGFTELTIVLEELGRALVCAPFFSSAVLGAFAILNAGSEADRQAMLPGIGAGTTRATLAVSEPSGSWDASGVAMVARPNGGTYLLSGTKHYVLDGHTADQIVVVARAEGTSGDDGLGFFVVSGDSVGLTREPLATMDQTRKQAKLVFDNVEACALGVPGSGGPALRTTMQQAAVALANEMVGGAQRVLEMAVEYAKVRVQFGRPIGSFQAIKHKCADMLLEVESAKSAAYYASWAATEGNDELPVVSSLAKAYCSDAYFHAAAENIQIHGGIGFTWEHDAHLYFKRAKSSEIMFGDATHHRELLAQEIGM
ncbi:MAG: acyl-CoA dehydrogenase family protein [Acidimicrobiia bacterium]